MEYIWGGTNCLVQKLHTSLLGVRQQEPYFIKLGHSNLLKGKGAYNGIS